MSAADSIYLTTGEAWSLTTDWQNLWTLCNLKRIDDGLPEFNKHCRTLNLFAPNSNSDAVLWARSDIGDNPAGELTAGESTYKQSGDKLQNENMFNIYVKGAAVGQELYVERTQ